MSIFHKQPLRNWFKEIMQFGQTRELMSPVELGLKLFEEGGELSESILWHSGLIQHKELKEPMEGEIADCLMLMLAAFSKSFPDETPEQLMVRLEEAFKEKFKKYQHVIEFASQSPESPPNTPRTKGQIHKRKPLSIFYK